MTRAAAVRPERTEKELLSFLRRTVRDALKFGVISIHDAVS